MNLEALTSDLLRETRHGFFTRKGGASSGVFAGLNCGTGSPDQADAVALNRARVAEAMGVPASHLTGPYQVHSADVIKADAPLAEPRPKADALVTATEGLALCVLTADCMPVLFADPEARVIGAAHAGWRGACAGVLENTVQAMTDLGAQRGRIRAAIGPCISQAAYEVGPELQAEFLKENPENKSFFIDGREDRALFDLPGFGLHKLRESGVKAEWIGACTYADEARFFSYRRMTHRGEADYGRLISTITLAPKIP